MNDETNQLLRQLIDLQKEQLALMRENMLPLWKRIRFSMLSLLALMTLVGIGLGIMVFAVRAPSPLPPTPTLQPTFPAPLPIDTDDDPFGSLAPDPNIR